MQKLTILLVEDTEVHRQVAIDQLKDHNLIICENFNEFEHKTRMLNEEKYLRYKQVLTKKEKDRDSSEKYCVEFFDKIPFFLGKIDVVLTDCLMPATDANALAFEREKWENQEVSFGPTVLLWAIRNNIKKAGLLMLNNHHDHPIAASFDCLLWRSSGRPVSYGNTKVLIETGNYFMNAEGGQEYNGINYNGKFVKCWDLFLEKLIEN